MRALITIVAGLTVHFGGDALSPDARDITGDALWAAMMVWWVGALAPAAPALARAAIAYGICLVVEFSQLIRTLTLDALRTNMLGRLVLGSGFDPRDLFVYLAGAAIAVIADRISVSRRTRGSNGSM